MSRPLRISYPGAFYHVTSRGNEKKNVFLSDQDRKKFIEYIEPANEKYGAIIHCYCLMSNHYHLLLETPRGNLPRIMHQINASYTTYFNCKRSRSGHLFQGRYKAILVDKDEYIIELSRYIHMNPVRAKMIENPWDYKWSSCSIYVGAREVPAWLETGAVLGSFGKDPFRAYKAFVVKENDFEPYRYVHASSILGSEGFLSRIQKHIRVENFRDVTASRKAVMKPTLEMITKAANDLPRKNDARKMSLYLAQTLGYSLREIGDYFDMKPAAVSQSNLRFKQVMKRDPKTRKAVDEIRKILIMSIVET